MGTVFLLLQSGSNMRGTADSKSSERVSKRTHWRGVEKKRGNRGLEEHGGRAEKHQV